MAGIGSRPPRISNYLVPSCLDTIHARGTYYPAGHLKSSNPFSRLIRKAKKGDRGSLDLLCSLMVDFVAAEGEPLPPIDSILGLSVTHDLPGSSSLEAFSLK